MISFVLGEKRGVYLGRDIHCAKDGEDVVGRHGDQTFS